MLGSDVPFSSWANQPFEIQNFLSPFTSAILRLACSTSRTVMFRLLRRLFSFSPAGTALLASFWTVGLFSLVASRRDAEFGIGRIESCRFLNSPDCKLLLIRFARSVWISANPDYRNVLLSTMREIVSRLRKMI